MPDNQTTLFKVFRDGLEGNKPVSYEEAVDFLDACEIMDADRIEFILGNGLPFEIDGAQLWFERIQPTASEREMTNKQTTRRKAMIRSVIVFLVAPVAASVALTVGVLHMATYVGFDLRQFDPETEMGLRIFGLAVLGIVGVYLAAWWITAPPSAETTAEIVEKAQAKMIAGCKVRPRRRVRAANPWQEYQRND